MFPFLLDVILIGGIVYCIKHIRDLRAILDSRNAPPKNGAPDVPVDEQIRNAIQTHIDTHHRRG